MKYLTQVEPGQKVHLDKIDPSDTGKVEKVQGQAELQDLSVELGELQELLYAANTHSVLIVLQSLDAGGKNGVIRRVLGDVNPEGCHVENFGVPSEREAAHDFLWRVHRVTPMQGEISVFNRSHYEDVLVARVHELVAPNVWQARYEHINKFEKLLSDNRTIILKFYLHISKEEQEKRLLAREQDVKKTWKLNVGDWQERSRWDDYQRAYEDALSQCSTSYAPWSIVPADHKWYRNLAVAHAIVSALRPLKKGWLEFLTNESKERLAELEKFRAEDGAISGKPEP